MTLHLAMTGLVPGIQGNRLGAGGLDCRVKPGNDVIP